MLQYKVSSTKKSKSKFIFILLIVSIIVLLAYLYIFHNIDKISLNLKQARVNIYYNIKSVEEIKKTILTGDNDFDLPVKVKGYYNNNNNYDYLDVKWNTSNIDTKKTGRYIINGVIKEKYKNIKCNSAVKCEIEIISKEEAIKKIL